MIGLEHSRSVMRDNCVDYGFRLDFLFLPSPSPQPLNNHAENAN